MTVTSGLDEIVAAASALAPVLEANREGSERDRRLADGSVAAMGTAGMWRLLTPGTYGGAEAGIRAQVDALGEVSAVHPSAGWVQLVSNAHVWMVGSFPHACQEEVFAGGPDVRVPGTLAAQGRATRVDGGWQLDGRWQFASGVDHGDWVMVGAVADHLPESADRGLHLLARKEDLVVDDTWFTLGLRATGSKDVVAERAFVPDHRAMPTRALFDGQSPHGEIHATRLNRVPVLVSLATQLAGSVVGMAEGALALHVERTRSRRDVYTGSAKRDRAGMQMRVAESAGELSSARLLVRRAADRCDEVGRTGVHLTIDERAELKWHAAYVVELCRRAVERLFAASGAHGIYDDSAMLHWYRDVNTACHHAVADLDGTAEMYGRVRLGLDPGTPLV